ncbi:Ig-like domain-containing protein [Plantactinospora solaniradicis]|uniref:Ig-like domain-containing protein n=1 Tax=Plantactinospora solaniradicis TaxID=1723736 RepID=A0ABW1KN09_9ACTN
MWSRRTSTAILLAALVVVMETPKPTLAGGPGEPILADFNDDGIIDRAVLGAIHPNLCSLIIQYGSAPGVFLPPIAYTYQRPGVDVGTNCPDIGTAFDADNDRFDELWLAWSDTVPPGITYNRIAIDQDFTTITTFTSPLPNPTYLGTQDFTGTGVVSPFAVGPGGYYTSMIVDGVAVPGLAQWCSANAPAFQHADFDRDRRVDVVLSYTDGCTDHGNGVVVLLATGERRQLELDLTAQDTWRAQVASFGSDRFLDVRTQNLRTGEVNFFHGVGNGDFVRGPRAQSDRVQLARVRPVAIDVLANDYATSTAQIVITVPPRYGTARVLSDKRILYSPRQQHGLTDRFTYQIRSEGRRSSAVVRISFPESPPGPPDTRGRAA